MFNNPKFSRSTLCKAILLSSAGVIMSSQLANAEDADNNSSVFSLEEVVVTATRRSTSLASTPLAISAMTDEMLKKADVVSMADLAAEVTGLNIVDQGAGLHRPVIRGLQGVGDAQVGIYLDNTPITGSPGTGNSAGRFSPEIVPIDMERVEVLRGPQGTLYGGGAMGGAIRYITNKPDASGFEGSFALGVNSIEGNFGYNGNVVLNMPIVEDELAVRFVGYTRDEEGWIDNLPTGESDVNSFEKSGARVMVGWTPTDNFTLTGTYINEIVEAGARNIVHTDLADLTTRNPGNDSTDDDVSIFNLTAEYQTSFADIVYSYSKYERDLIYRLSFVTDIIRINPPNLGGSLLVQPQDVNTDVHEIRFVSNNDDSNFQWTVGAFSSERETFGLSDIYNLDTVGNLIFPDAIGSPGAREGDVPNSLTFRRSVTQAQREKAIFGELSYNFTEDTTLTVGARVFDFENDDGGQSHIIRGAFRTPPEDFPFREAKSSHDGEVFKLKLSHEILDDSVVYASFSQGFRAGGANVELLSAGGDPQDTPTSFEPDQADNYELGFRGSLNDGRMTLAAAAFYIDWQDLFVDLRRSDLAAAGVPFNLQFRANAGQADITGLEFEIESLVTDNLKLSAGATILDAELSSDVQQIGNSTGASEGDDLPFVPDYTYNLTAEYGWNLNNGLRAFAWGGYRYTGTTFGDFNPFLPGTTTPNIRYTEYGDYGVFNLKFGIEGDTWSSALSIGNVTDKRECTYIRADGNRPAPGNCFVEKPRSVSLQFNKSF